MSCWPLPPTCSALTPLKFVQDPAPPVGGSAYGAAKELPATVPIGVRRDGFCIKAKTARAFVLEVFAERPADESFESSRPGRVGG